MANSELGRRSENRKLKAESGQLNGKNLLHKLTKATKERHHDEWQTENGKLNTAGS
jgi:hypothetical protein